MGLEKWADHKVEALSKGMAQKIQFISAVMRSRQLLILDEPFSGLDPVNLEVLRAAILEQRQRGTTVIFSTHDMTMAEQLCDFVFMIYKGRKVLDGTLAAIQSSYGTDTVRLRVEGGDAAWRGLEGVQLVRDLGQLPGSPLCGRSPRLCSRHWRRGPGCISLRWPNRHCTTSSSALPRRHRRR